MSERLVKQILGLKIIRGLVALRDLLQCIINDMQKDICILAVDHFVPFCNLKINTQPPGYNKKIH